MSGVANFIDQLLPDEVFTVVNILDINKTEDYGAVFVDKIVGAYVETAMRYGSGAANLFLYIG